MTNCYDRNGNITHLERRGIMGNEMTGLIDCLALKYIDHFP